MIEYCGTTDRERLKTARRLVCTGDPSAAFTIAQAELARADDDRMRAEWADCLATCCLKMLRYEAGVGYAKQAAAIWQTQRNLSRFAQSLSKLAEFLADLGAPDALATAQQAIELAERSGNPKAQARAYMTMGLVLFMAKQADKAVPFAERAVAIKAEAGLIMTIVLINAAEAIALAGVKAADAEALPRAIARAVTLTREALAEARATGDGWTQRLALNNIAEHSMYINDVQTAAASLAEVAATPGTPTQRCRAHYFITQAKVLAALGRLEWAREMFTACLEVVQDGDYMELEADCYQHLTDVLKQMKRFDEALQAHEAFHARYVRLASEGAQRLARLAAHEHEVKELRKAAGHAQSLAASLVQTNAELAMEAERLKQANLEDSLTGLPNRRRLELALAELDSNGEDFACAMLDVDHFKSVNDRFSHVVGDAVLRKIGEIFAQLARHDDLLARFGGEEFALLIRSHDAASVLNVCERLRAAIEETNWENIEPGLAIRISVGFALSFEAEPAELVVKLADERLYAAKAAGRNQVVGPLARTI